MIFDKPTLRTQSSFAAGIAELGGNPLAVNGDLAQIGVRESVEDVARVLGRQAAQIVWRTNDQAKLDAMAQWSGVPVINALSDDFHPCQLLRTEEHTSELQSLMRISYAVLCLTKHKKQKQNHTKHQYTQHY